MTTEADVAAVAALIGDPARAAMLDALLDPRGLPVGALAGAAGIARSTASGHLARLLRAGLVTVAPEGRRRVYRLAGPEVAAALEALAVIAPPRPAAGLRGVLRTQDLRAARTCYDHLAGALGVALAERLCVDGLLEPGDLALTDAGSEAFAGFGIDVAALRAGRRPLTRACLDWSERRPHLAGALGAALTGELLRRGWLRRQPGSRAVALTRRGEDGLEAAFGLLAPPLEAGAATVR